MFLDGDKVAESEFALRVVRMERTVTGGMSADLGNLHLVLCAQSTCASCHSALGVL